MAYVVTDNCIACKYTDCVTVCPVDAFHEGPNFLAINPDVCISCDLCPPECPAGAIFPEESLAPEQTHFIALNAELAQQWPVITEVIAPLPDAEQFDGVEDKLHLLETE